MISIVVDEHIALKSYEPKDAPVLFEAIDQNRAHLRPWLNWIDATTHPDHTLAFIESSIAAVEEQTGLAMGIFCDGQIVGGMGMHDWDHRLRKAQIGYWIAKDYEGKGLVSRCLRSFLKFLFEQLGMNKIEIRFVASNERSAAIVRRFNLRIEGVLRDSYVSNGKLEDLVVAGLLKREWQESLKNESV